MSDESAYAPKLRRDRAHGHRIGSRATLSSQCGQKRGPLRLATRVTVAEAAPFELRAAVGWSQLLAFCVRVVSPRPHVEEMANRGVGFDAERHDLSGAALADHLGAVRGHDDVQRFEGAPVLAG